MTQGSVFAPSERVQKSPGFAECPERHCMWWCCVTQVPGMSLLEVRHKAELELTAHLRATHDITTIGGGHHD